MKPLLFFFAFSILLGQVCPHSFPSCPGTRKRANETWLDGIVELRCSETTPNGKLEAVVIACYAIIEHPAPAIRIPIGTTQLVPFQGLKKCVETSSGVGELVAVTKSMDTTARPVIHPDCSEPENVNKQWIEGRFVRACKAIERSDHFSHYVDFVEIAFQCITPGGYYLIEVEEEKAVGDGSVYDCVRVNKTEAELVLLSPEEAMLPRKCENGKRVNETWEDDHFEMACRIVSGKATIEVIACISTGWTGYRYRIEVGASMGKPEDGQQRCVRIDGRLAKLEKHQPICTNGRKLGEEWEDDNFLKACEKEKDIADAELAIIVVRACLVEGVKISVGKFEVVRKREGDAKCQCTRSDNRENRFGNQAVAATLTCQPLDATAGNRTPRPIGKPEHCMGENMDKEWIEGAFVRACKVIVVEVTDRNVGWYEHRKAVDVAFRCITPEGDRITVEDEKQLVDGSVYDCFRVNQTEAKLVLLSPEEAKLPRKCSNGRRVNETWVDKMLELSCQVDNTGEPAFRAVACYEQPAWGFQKHIRIPLGETRSTGGNGLRKCVPTEDGLAKTEEVAPICDNGKKLGEEWEEGNRLLKCEADYGIADCDDCTVVVEKACVINGTTIPLGEKGSVTYQDGVEVTCACRTDKRKGQQVHSATMDCVQNGIEKIVEIPSVTLNCQDPENWKKEVVIGDFVRTCDLNEGENPYTRFNNDYSIVEVTIGCITPTGDRIKVEEEKRVQGGAVYDCVRVDKTEAKLVLLTPSEAALPRKCSNGRRVNGKWFEKELELTCQVNSMGVPVIAVVACIHPYPMTYEGIIRIPLGETHSTGGSGLRKCVPTEDGLAKAEYVVPVCDNGRKRGEEWTEDPFLKACENNGVADSDGVIVVVKACVVKGVVIPVGEERKMKDYAESTCRCEGKRADYGITDAEFFCDGAGPNPPVRPMPTPLKTTAKPTILTRPNCKDFKNLNKEVIEGNFVRACKNITFYKKREIRYTTLRCITPQGDQVAVGKTKATATGTYSCKKLPYGKADLVFVKKPTSP